MIFFIVLNEKENLQLAMDDCKTLKELYEDFIPLVGTVEEEKKKSEIRKDISKYGKIKIESLRELEMLFCMCADCNALSEMTCLKTMEYVHWTKKVPENAIEQRNGLLLNFYKEV